MSRITSDTRYRKLGDYDDSEVLVREGARRRPQPRAHVVLLRHVAGGAGQQAQGRDYLQKVKLICGTADCEEYRQLRAVIDGTASY